MGGRHGGAAHVGIGGAIVPVGAVDARPWRCYRNLHPIVRPRGLGIILIRPRYPNHVVVSSRVEKIADIVVAHRPHQHTPFVPGIVHHRLQKAREGITTQTQTDHLGPVLRSVHDAVGDIAIGRRARGAVPHLHSHDAAVVAHPGNAHAIVCGRSRDASTVGAVPIVILGIMVIVGEVPAVYVVNVAVPIIVNAVARYLAWVGPHLSRQVWVLQINAPVQDGNYDASVSFG